MIESLFVCHKTISLETLSEKIQTKSIQNHTQKNTYTNMQSLSINQSINQYR